MNSAPQNPAPSARRSPVLPVLGAVAVLAIIVVAAVAANYLWPSGSGVGQPVGQMDAGALSEAMPSSHMPQLPQPTGIGSLFEAQPSDQMTPTIEMKNYSSSGNVHVIFSGPANVTKTMPPGGTVEFELPQGTYHVRAWHDTTSPREGTAVFRRHTQYSCGWELSDSVPAGPLRIGDIE